MNKSIILGLALLALAVVPSIGLAGQSDWSERWHAREEFRRELRERTRDRNRDRAEVRRDMQRLREDIRSRARERGYVERDHYRHEYRDAYRDAMRDMRRSLREAFRDWRSGASAILAGQLAGRPHGREHSIDVFPPAPVVDDAGAEHEAAAKLGAGQERFAAELQPLEQRPVQRGDAVFVRSRAEFPRPVPPRHVSHRRTRKQTTLRLGGAISSRSGASRTRSAR